MYQSLTDLLDIKGSFFGLDSWELLGCMLQFEIHGLRKSFCCVLINKTSGSFRLWLLLPDVRVSKQTKQNHSEVCA